MGDWDKHQAGQDAAETRNWISAVYHSVWRKNVMRSGMVTVILIACVLLGLTIAFRAHQQGNFHKLKLRANIDTEHRDARVPTPGGQEAIILLRSPMAGDMTPQFLSATLLPGRGMNVLQITAFIPGRGEVSLLASPSVEGAEAVMTGKGADGGGQASLSMGGAFGVPWAGNLGVGASSSEGAEWHTQPIPPIAINAGGFGSERDGGLLLAAPADSSDSEALPDGGTAQAVFHKDNFRGRWTSKTDVSVSALLSSRAIELTVIATNVGDVTEPVGIGWSPRFAVSEPDYAAMRLHLPAESRLEIRDHAKNLPSGKLLPLGGGARDFSVSGGASLNGAGVDEYYTDLQQKLLDNGPATELINRMGGYGLRLTAMSPKIRAIHVVAPAQGNFVSIDPQYNLPDPFGKEWDGAISSGMVMLAPGETTEWKVRLELYALNDNNR